MEQKVTPAPQVLHRATHGGVSDKGYRMIEDITRGQLSHARHQQVERTLGRTAADDSKSFDQPTAAEVTRLSDDAAEHVGAEKRPQHQDEPASVTKRRDAVLGVPVEDAPDRTKTIIDNIVQMAPESHSSRQAVRPWRSVMK